MHPGITMHKIPVEGAAGLAFTVGVLVTILLSLPQARWFLALSLPTGLVIGSILRLTSRD
jgi:NhaP-type Na+/H+ and K+/H+ antiporter